METLPKIIIIIDDGKMFHDMSANMQMYVLR